MNYKKLVITTVLTILCVSLTISKVLAIQNYNISLQGEENEVFSGDTIEYDIYIEDIDQNNGIVMLNAVLDYDNDTFDIEVNEIEDSKWIKNTMLEDYFIMATEDLSAVVENQKIAKLMITVKDDAFSGEKIINLTNIKLATDNGTTVNVEDKSISLNVHGTDIENNDIIKEVIDNSKTEMETRTIIIVLIAAMITLFLIFLLVVIIIGYMKANKRNLNK